MQFPSTKERRPVDVIAQIGQVPIVIDMDPWLLRRGWFHAFVNFKGVGARFFQCSQRLSSLAGAGITDVAIFNARISHELLRHRVADQCASHTDCTRCIKDMDDRAGIDRFNAQGRMGFGGGCAANHQRHGHSSLLHFLGNGDHFIKRRRDKPG